MSTMWTSTGKWSSCAPNTCRTGTRPRNWSGPNAATGSVKMHYADGRQFVRRVAENDDEDAKYDIIVADLPGEREERRATQPPFRHRIPALLRGGATGGRRGYVAGRAVRHCG